MVDNITVCVPYMLTIEELALLEAHLLLHPLEILFLFVDEFEVRVEFIHDIAIGISVMLSVEVVPFLIEFNLLRNHSPGGVGVVLRLVMPLVTLLEEQVVIFGLKLLLGEH